MNVFLEKLQSIDWWMLVMATVDSILFLLYFAAVIYLFIFAVASTFKRKKEYKTAKKHSNFAVFIFHHQNDSNLKETEDSFAQQEYPADKFKLFVIGDSNSCMNKAERIMVEYITCPESYPGKAKQTQYALNTLPDKVYDAVIILDSGNVAGTNFLQKINNAFVAGNKAIQTHRVSKNLDTDTSLFGAVSEEINNSIYRKGHVNIGFSSALIGSGMIFSFAWLKANMSNATCVDLEKQLETKLLKQFIYIEYMSDVTVRAEKASKVSEYFEQRNAWLSNRVKILNILFYQLPGALIQGNMDYSNKLIQWLMPSRTILIGTLLLIACGLIVLSWGMAIKWLAILLMLIVAFSIALPDEYVDTRFIKAMRGAPLLFLVTAYQILKRKIFKQKEVSTLA